MGKYYEHVRRVRVGVIYKMNPSMGFQGIESGYIKVVDFVDYKKVPDDCAEKEYLVEDAPEWKKCPWVKYRYEDKKKQSYGQDWFFPVDLFAEHISMY